MQNVAFRAGDTIISEGEAGDTAFFIVNGSVDVIIGRGAHARIIGKLQAGEVFGEMCLIDPGARSASIVATSDGDCLSTSYAEFIAAIEENPARAVHFMKTLVRRLRQMNDMMEGMDPRKRGIREMFRDWQATIGPYKPTPEAALHSWRLLC